MAGCDDSAAAGATVRCASIRAAGCPPRRAGRRGCRPRPASSKIRRASSISAIAVSTGSRSATARRPAAAVGSSAPARSASSIARTNPARTAASSSAASIPYSAANSLARLAVAQRHGERLAADAELAGRSVERRERELLRGLLDALRRGPLARRARVGDRGRLVAAPAGGEVGDDEGGGGGKREQDQASATDTASARARRASRSSVPLRAHSWILRRAIAIGISAASANAGGDQERGAERVGRRAIDLDPRSASRRSIVAARSAGSSGSGSNAGPTTGTLSPSAAIWSAIAAASSSFAAGVIARVEQRRGPRLLGVGALGLEIAGEHRGQHQQAGDDARRGARRSSSRRGSPAASDRRAPPR